MIMGIKVTCRATIKSVESKLELKYKKERQDIAKLLSAIKSGTSLDSIFTKPIASSVERMLANEKLVDASGQITPTGEKFIVYPYKNETENGLYSVYLAKISLDSSNFNFVPKMERKLANDQRSQESVDLKDIFTENEFTISDTEIGCMVAINNQSKSYIKNLGERDIQIDIEKDLYEYEGKRLKAGNEIITKLKEYVEKSLNDANLGFTYDALRSLIIIKKINDISEEDLYKGEINQTIDNIQLSGAPFTIDDESEAKSYAYFYMYKLLLEDNYYTLQEMNEIFQNEILSKKVIGEKIKDRLSDFTYTIDGFGKYLSQEKFNKLSYKLKVMKTLLDVEGIRDAEGFSSARSYDSLLKILKTKVAPSEVKSLYMVMGYALAFSFKHNNKIVDCIKTFKEAYPNITIVDKSYGDKVEEDKSIKQEINNLGVPILKKPVINKCFHDRYLIFELKDGVYRTFLVTCEIGSIFNAHTNEPKGTLFPIPNTDLTRNGKSMIRIIKEN